MLAIVPPSTSILVPFNVNGRNPKENYAYDSAYTRLHRLQKDLARQGYHAAALMLAEDGVSTRNGNIAPDLELAHKRHLILDLRETDALRRLPQTMRYIDHAARFTTVRLHVLLDTPVNANNGHLVPFEVTYREHLKGRYSYCWAKDEASYNDFLCNHFPQLAV